MNKIGAAGFRVANAPGPFQERRSAAGTDTVLAMLDSATITSTLQWVVKDKLGL